MKALSLHQPWASLVAVGAKRVETRSWRTHHRGRVAIHAARFPGLLHLAREEPFAAALRGIELPLGVVLATARLVDCVPTVCGLSRSLTAVEHAFGDYSEGRWAWLLEDVEPLATPVPARGYPGLWEWGG